MKNKILDSLPETVFGTDEEITPVQNIVLDGVCSGSLPQ